MKANKLEMTGRIFELIEGRIRACVKLSLDNIVFPKWSDIGLWGEIMALKVKTKEQPEGCDYDETKYQVVLRIINGKVLMTGGRPDAYTWKQSKVENHLADPDNIRLIGANSASAVLNLAAVLATIPDREEQLMLADMFCNFNKDMLLVTTPSEDRFCVEITQDLYDAGLTACIDSWMEEDADGMADVTRLFVGDFLIVDGQQVYCIRREEFLETHELV